MTLKDALLLGRVSNLPTVWTNVLAGAVLAGADLRRPPLLALLSLSLFYVAGMYLNDAFDREIDARERKERPIPSGRVRAGTVFALGFGMLATGVVTLAIAGGDRAAAAGLALAVVIVFYDVHHKKNPLSPLVMGLCRAGVYVVSALAVTGTITAQVWIGAALLVSYLIGLTYAAKQESLRRLTSVWPLAFVFLPLVVTLPTAVDEPGALVAAAVFVVWIARCLGLLLRRDGADVRGAVVRLIAGIALLDALLIAHQGHIAVAIVAAAGCAMTRLFQRYVPGT